MPDLRNEHGHAMHHDEIYERLGLDPKKHLPREGLGPIDVDGIKVYVLAADDPRRQRVRRGDGRILLRGKRTFAICSCGTHVEAGHLHQHMRGKACCRKRGIDWIHPGFRSRGGIRRYGQ